MTGIGMFDFLLKTTRDNLLIINPEGMVIDGSESLCRMLGIRKDNLFQKYLYDMKLGLSMTQILTYIQLIKEKNYQSMKTYFYNMENCITPVSIKGVYSKEENIIILYFFEVDDAHKHDNIVGHKNYIESLETTSDTYLSAELMEATLLQDLMNVFYPLTGMPIGIIDLKGNILVKEGWQDICMKFHRQNPESCKRCIESDYNITEGLKLGEYREYKCMNNMWDIATPIFVGERCIGHIFLGQFFYDDEHIDEEFFIKQADRFGYDKEAYIQALSGVPRFSKEKVHMAMSFYSKLANLISKISYSNVSLKDSIEQLYQTLNLHSVIMNAVPIPVFYKDTNLRYLGANTAFEKFTGLSPSEYLGKTVDDIAPNEFAEIYTNADRALLMNQGKQVYETHVRSSDGRTAEVIFNKSTYKDVDGNVIGLIGVIQDITELTNAKNKLKKVNDEIIKTQKEVIYTLGQVIETRSLEAAKHVVRVSEYCYLVAKKLGMSEEEALNFKTAAPMHDVGKIGISDLILNKESRLTEEEYNLMKKHTLIGFEILKNSKYQILKIAAIIAHEHHEKWDGTGYPKGLQGEEISLFARILSVADVFDATSHKRCYKEAWEIDKVKNYIIEQSGKMFDPRIVDVFLENWDDILKIRELYSDKNDQ